MYEGHRAIVCIPAGRYRYLRVLLPYLLTDETIDEICLWVNTDVKTDLEYFVRMRDSYPTKISLLIAEGRLTKQAYDLSRDHYQYNDSIYRFYAACVEEDALYCKLDDDICYVHPEFFKNMFRDVLARESTNYACVGNVFNVPYVTKLLQDRGFIDTMLGTSTADPRCPVACTDGDFAVHIHRQFLKAYEEGRVNEQTFDSHEIKGRQRIGAMAWSGRNFATFGGNVGPSDEVDLTTKIPERLGKPLWMVGDAIVSHLAFSHQRAAIEDHSNILERYLALAIKLHGDKAA